MPLPPESMFLSTFGVFWAAMLIPIFIRKKQYHLLLLTGALFGWIDMNLNQQDIDTFTNFTGTLLKLVLLLNTGIIIHTVRQRYLF